MLIYGKNVARDLLKKDKKIEKIILQDHFDDKEIISLIEKKKIRYKYMPKREIDYSGKIALVIGNEGKGISKLVEKSCDYIAKIPMYGKTNSLNASVAAGIMIYEVIRNRK